jgi:hypothetical protein
MEMRLPMWVTLKEVPDEFHSNALEIAGALGTVIGKHRGNAINADQKFCVAIPSGQAWPLTIGVTNPETGEKSRVCVDYNNLPIRCRYYLSTSHLVRDCRVLYPRKDKDEGNKVAEKAPEPAAEAETQAAKTTVPATVPAAPVVVVPAPAPASCLAPDTSDAAQHRTTETSPARAVGSSASSDSPPLSNRVVNQTGIACRDQTQVGGPGFLTWEDWRIREIEQGCAASPHTSEFIDSQEFDLTKKDWRARGLGGGASSINQVISSRTLFSHLGIGQRQELSWHPSQQPARQLWIRSTQAGETESGIHDRLANRAETWTHSNIRIQDEHRNQAQPSVILEVVRMAQLVPIGTDVHRPMLDLNRVDGSARLEEVEGGACPGQPIEQVPGNGSGRFGGGTFSEGNPRSTNNLQPVYQEWLNRQGIQNHFSGPPHQPRISQRELLCRNHTGGTTRLKRGIRQPQRSC